MTMLPSFRLDNQIAVVTGGGKGIGRGIALCLAQAGADVVVASRSKADLDAVVAEIEALGRRALAVPTDAGYRGPYAGVRAHALHLVQHAQYPFLYRQGF